MGQLTLVLEKKWLMKFLNKQLNMIKLLVIG